MNTTILEGMNALHEEMKEWMNHMHQYPELALQKTETGIVASMSRYEFRDVLWLQYVFYLFCTSGFLISFPFNNQIFNCWLIYF
jgi:hypothetical protein